MRHLDQARLRTGGMIDLLLVHIGGGLWGIFAVPIFRRRVDPGPVGIETSDRIFSIIYYITAGESWRVNFTAEVAIRSERAAFRVC